MAYTYELISSYTATGSVSSVDFTSIPNTYTDLCLKLSVRTTVSNTSSTTYLYINGVLTNRVAKVLYGTHTTKGSYSNTGGIAGDTNGGTSTSNTFGNQEIYIANYASSKYKPYSIDAVTEMNSTATDNTLMLAAGVWSSSSAITSVGISLSPDSIAQHSTIQLYGIKNS